MNTVTAEPGRTRINAFELIAQVVLALAIGLAIAITLGGAVLLLGVAAA